MEGVAYLAGEEHSDTPVCVSPVLQRFCIAFNDRLADDQRQRLRPYLARTIGTAGDGQDEERLRLCREWLVRGASPKVLDLAGEKEAAERLRQLPDDLTLENVRRTLLEVRDQAYAARERARARLRGAAWVAEAAEVAGAAWVAGVAEVAEAAGVAEVAEAAGVAPSYDEIRAAIRARLQPTLDELCDAGFDLLERMLPKEIIQLPVAEDAEAVCALA
jgi:hypothetical protein